MLSFRILESDRSYFEIFSSSSRNGSHRRISPTEGPLFFRRILKDRFSIGFTLLTHERSGNLVRRQSPDHQPPWGIFISCCFPKIAYRDKQLDEKVLIIPRLIQKEPVTPPLDFLLQPIASIPVQKGEQSSGSNSVVSFLACAMIFEFKVVIVRFEFARW